MKLAETFMPRAYIVHPETSLSSKLEAFPPNIVHEWKYMHLVWHPRSSEMSAALLSVQVGSACNVNSHSLGSVQLGLVRFGSAWLGLQCEWALILSTSGRWVVKFTHRPLHPCAEEPQYALNRELVGPQSQCRCFGEYTNLLSCWNSNPESSIPYFVTVLAVLSELQHMWHNLRSWKWTETQH